MDHEKIPYLRLWLAFMWAGPFVAVGIVLCILIVGIPLGLLFFWLGCYPLVQVIKGMIRDNVEWEHRDRALPNDEPKPWEE